MTKKGTDIVSYITIVGWIIALLCGTREESKFHLNQSLVLILANIIWGVIGRVLAFIPIIGWLAIPIGYLIIFVLWVMGLVYALQGQEKAELGFAESEFRLQGRHDDTEILTHEIEQRIADHQDYQGLPLPVIVLFLDALVHRERDYSVLWYLPVKKPGQDKDMNNRK